MIFEKVRDIISNELSVAKDEITLETNLQDDLGADSLDAVELVMSIEDEFNIQIPDDVAQKLRTVEDIVKYLEEHVN
ncbi:MAG: acyl carrier protein [Bacilli bacterium]|nr:acyl carrier protein [Bacilli bacterium]